jgi:hypothetical protein
MKKIYILIILMIVVSTVSCTVAEDLPSFTPEPSATPKPTATPVPEPVTITLSWKFETDEDNEYLMPETKFYLIETGPSNRTMLIHSTIGRPGPVSDRTAWEIPEEAENVFYTYWAGYGEHFYTKVDEGNIFRLMMRPMDEMQMEWEPFEVLFEIDYPDDLVLDVKDPLGDE